MADFSVLGEILGETNLDRVGESIQESMEKVADKLEDTSSSAKIADETIENLAMSMGGLERVSSSAENELDDVGEEMTEVAGKSQAATASVGELNAMLATTDGADIGSVVDDLARASRVTSRAADEGVGIGAIGGPGADFDPQTVFQTTGARRALTDALDLDRKGDIASRFMISEALGGTFESMEEFGEGLHTILQDATDETVDMSQILDGISDSFDAAADSASSFSRSLPDDTDVLSEELAGTLQPFGDRTTTRSSQIRPSVAGSNTIAELFESLSKSRAVGGSDTEILGGILEAVDAAENAADVAEDVTDASEDVSANLPDDDILADALKRSMQPPEGRTTVNRGQLLPSVESAENVEELFDSLRRSRAVGGSDREILDRLRNAIDATDELSRMGVPRDIDSITPDVTDTPTQRQGTRIRTETIGDDAPGKEIIDGALRKELFDLGEITEEQLKEGFDSSAIPISEETDRALGSESVRKGLDASSIADDLPDDETINDAFSSGKISDGVDESDLRVGAPQIGEREFNSLSDSLDEASRSFSESADEIGEATQYMGRGEVERYVDRGGSKGFVGELRQNVDRDAVRRVAASRRGNRISGLGEALSELTQASLQTTTTLGFVTAGMTALTASSKNADMAVDDLDDEVGDLARSLSALAPALKTVSANLGPFNIGLTNLAITIPALIATVGPLITLFLGLASAAVAVAGAFGAIVAVGAMGFLQDLEDQFAGINNTMEAVEATAKGFKEAIIDAIEPLQGVTIGGLDATGIFVTVMRDVVQLVHMFAEATAELLEMQVVEDFLLNLRAAVLGFSDATDGLTMIEGLKELMRGALPVLEDFFIWFIDKLPDAMAFFGQITAELGQPISEVGKAMLNLVTVVTKVGTGIANQLLAPLALTIKFFTGLIAIALGIYDTLGSVADIVAAATIGFATLTLAVVKSIQVFEFGVELHRLVTNTIEKMNDAVENADNAYDAYRQAVNKANSSLIAYTSIAITAIVVTSLFVVGIYLILSGLGLLEPVAKLVSSAIGFLKENVFGAARAFERATGGLIPLTEMIEVAAGVLALYTAFQIAATGSTVAGTKAMYGQLVPLGALIKSKLAYLGAVTLSTLANYGFISSAVAMEVQMGTLTGAINAANVSLTLFQVLTGIAIVTAIAILISELTGLTNAFTDVETAVFGLLTALGTLAAVAKYAGYSLVGLAGSITAVNIALTGGVLGAILAMIIGLRKLNKIAGDAVTILGAGIAVLTGVGVAAYFAASGITALLIVSVVGAIVVGILIAIAIAVKALYNNWEKAKSIFKKGIGLMPIVQQFRILLKVIRIVWDYLSDIDGSTISFDVVGSIFPGIPDAINPLSGKDVANNRAAPGARTRNSESKTENNVEINVDNRGSDGLGARVMNKIKRAATDAIVENDMREQGR